VRIVGFANTELETISNIKTLAKLLLKGAPENHNDNLKRCRAGVAKLCLATSIDAKFVAKIILKGNALTRARFMINFVTPLNSHR
jgi:hypothetical protein